MTVISAMRFNAREGAIVADEQVNEQGMGRKSYTAQKMRKIKKKMTPASANQACREVERFVSFGISGFK